MPAQHPLCLMFLFVGVTCERWSWIRDRISEPTVQPQNKVLVEVKPGLFQLDLSSAKLWDLQRAGSTESPRWANNRRNNTDKPSNSQQQATTNSSTSQPELTDFSADNNATLFSINSIKRNETSLHYEVTEPDEGLTTEGNKEEMVTPSNNGNSSSIIQ